MQPRNMLCPCGSGKRFKHCHGQLTSDGPSTTATVDFVIAGTQRGGTTVLRSEEHTSELQSQSNLVCRLMLDTVNPPLGEGMKHVASAWPRRLPTHDLLGTSFAASCADALLRHVLESTTIRNVDLERLLTSIRAEFLRFTADGGAIRTLDDNAVAFCCALAKQCFINEYVFAVTPEEAEDAERLRQKLVEALVQDSTVSAIWPCVVA